MTEKINNNQPKDDSAAQAWVDTVSTFTERTGLDASKPQEQEAPSWADAIDWDNADSLWGDDMDFDNEDTQDSEHPDDAITINGPSPYEWALDEWGFDAPKESTPYDQEKARIEDIKKRGRVHHCKKNKLYRATSSGK